MINSKPCNVEDCNNPRFSKGFCKYHQHLRTDDKYKKSQDISKQNVNKHTPIKRTPIKKKFKASGEGVLFETVWATREHKSFISGVKLGEAQASMFSHCLPKSHYGKFRLYEKNIVLLTPEEHHLYDAGTEDQRERYAEEMWNNKNILVDWEKLYMLAEELKKEYNGTE